MFQASFRLTGDLVLRGDFLAGEGVFLADLVLIGDGDLVGLEAFFLGEAGLLPLFGVESSDSAADSLLVFLV